MLVRDVLRGHRDDGTPIRLTRARRARMLQQFAEQGWIPHDTAPEESREATPAVPNQGSDRRSQPCRHRGDTIEQIQCKPCQARSRSGRTVDVYACALHGRCVLESIGQRISACNRCSQYEPRSQTPSEQFFAQTAALCRTAEQIPWPTAHLAPIRPRPAGTHAWEGTAARKPWEYRAQLVIAHLDTPELLAVALPLWRLQTERPFVTIVDTGSTAENLARLLALEAEDVEVHCLRSRGFRHPSQSVAMALDVAMAVNQQEYQIHSHTDCFPRRRDLVADLLRQCGYRAPVVGYEISPRDHVRGELSTLWPGMVGHTCTALHVPTIRRLGITWHLDRGHDELGLAREPLGNTDTEVPFNLQLRRARIVPKLIGHDQNHTRQVTADFDHFRSFGSAQIYSPNYFARCSEWARAAIAEAKQRIEEWSREP